MQKRPWQVKILKLQLGMQIRHLQGHVAPIGISPKPILRPFPRLRRQGMLIRNIRDPPPRSTKFVGPICVLNAAIKTHALPMWTTLAKIS